MGRRFDRNGMFYKNRFSFVSLLIILGMYFIATSYYDPSSVVRKGSAMVTGEGTPKIGGDFSVIDHNGVVFTQENLKDKYSLVFFGFTHCPDICPTAMTVLSEVYDKLSDKQKSQTQVIMASIDPERDTVAVMKDYMAAFNESFIGLSGTEDQMKDMAKKYLVYHVKRPTDDGSTYTVDHSGYVYLLGPDGRYVKHFSHKSNASEIYEGLTSYLRK